MGTFMGGSAPAMANQVCDGYTLLTASTLKRLTLDQMQQLEFEMDKRLRETRGLQPDLQDQVALQQRNRRLSRIEAQIRVLRHTMQQRRMGRL
jgi:predicted DCC family thiol-disulfide oxidoreductase YuxK